MTDSRNGQVVTFYSYKGGTGRTMALANVAWILAANGKRVLVVDWDLESPGLHRFFSPFVNAEALASTQGVIDLIREYEWATTREVHRTARWHEQFAKVDKFSFSLDWRAFPGDGTLDYLSAGSQNNDYASTIAGINWDDFYERQGGGQFFDALRADMKYHYDYTLIDSRTGFSDVADICTIHLPDVLVDCFTLSDQGIEGAAQVARMVAHRNGTRRIRILPVPMRVDPAEKNKADVGRAVAKQRFAKLPSDMSDAQRDAYWASMQVPYQAFYAYEETLSTFGDLPGQQGTLLSAYELLTRHLTNGQVTALPSMDEATRSRVKVRFERRPTVVEEQVVLRYAPEDQVWAEWIEQVLVAAGVRVLDQWAIRAGDDGPGASSSRILTIISQTNAAEESTLVVPDRTSVRTPLAVYIADIAPLANVPLANSALIAGLPAQSAMERLLYLVGRPAGEAGASLIGAPRFPGEDSDIFNVPARNSRFTGREQDLRQLRSQLRTRTAVVISGTQPLALQGMGGIGKTQLAVEYAHRFRSSYDIVWWIGADPVTFVEGSLVDLGRELRIPMEATGSENARVVLQALGRSEKRWLLILDNAEDPDRVNQYIPRGSGHVLITSRNPSWGEIAKSMQVDVFQRRESIDHLSQRVPTIRLEEANQIADLLGDLPIAVAAAGAWLADTGASVDDYLRQIASQGPGDMREPASDRPVAVTWDLALARLLERSPAAYRLFQLCSVLAPEIALDLIYSDELATMLAPIDPSVSERLVRGSLVQQINRLALLRVDQREERGQGGERSRGGQILVHRVVQHVVRSRMTDDELAEARLQVQHVLAAARPEGEADDPETWQKFRMLWPHLEVADAVHSGDEAVRALLIDRVRYMWVQGDFAGARDLAQDIGAVWDGLLETMPDPTARAVLLRQALHLRFNLANTLRDLGAFEESRAIDEDVLRRQHELLRPDHPHTLMTAGSLAADLRGLGRYAEALDRDKLTYGSWLDLYGEDHPRTLAALSNLAVSYRLTGNFRAARERDDVVYRRRRIVLGENNPYTLYSASMIGRDMRDAGEYDRSISQLRAVHDAYTRTRGPVARGTLIAQANLAVSLGGGGHLHEAARLLEDAYERLNDTQGPGSPETLTCRLNLAVSLLAIGEASRANRELDEVRRAYTRGLGPEHPRTLACVNNLAMAALDMSDSARARHLAIEASGSLREVLGAEHPYAMVAQMNLAVCTAEDGVLEEARGIVRDVAERMTTVLGPEHPTTVRCRANQAMILTALGSSESEADIDQVLAQLIRRLGESHPAVERLRRRRYQHYVIDPHPF